MLDTMSRLPKLELDHEEWDLRGWPLRDPKGHTLGTIAELIVDTKTQLVSQVMLRDGRKYRAHDVFIGDHFATLDDVLFASQRDARAETMPADTVPADTMQKAAPRAEPAKAIPMKVATTGKAVAVSGPAAVAPQVAPRIVPNAPKASSTVTPTRAAARPKLEPMMHEQRSLRDEDVGSDVVIPLIEEELDVGTRRYDAGGVRVQTHITREPVERSVIVREEHVTIERKRVDKPLRQGELEASMHDEHIEMRAISEIPITQKRAHVVEEIVITRDVSEHVETISDTLRRTEAEVTQLPVDPKSIRQP
jgi:uncharacterized protein (TIGR02271 family)